MWLVSLAMMVLAERLVLSLSSLVGFDPSIVSQISRFLVRLLLVKLSRSVRSPFVGFISIMDKSFVRHR